MNNGIGKSVDRCPLRCATEGYALALRHGLAAANADVGATEMVGEEIVDLVRAGRTILHPHRDPPAW